MENPITINSALNGSDAASAVPAIAGFMLLAAVWHRRTVTERLVPLWQLETVGFTSWRRGANTADNRLEPPDFLFGEETKAGSHRAAGPQLAFTSDVHSQLVEAIRQAMRSGARHDAAHAVALGSLHEDRLVRLSAVISALEIFRLRSRELDRLRSRLPTEEELAAGRLEGLASDRSLLEDQLEVILRNRLGRERHQANNSPHRPSVFGRAPGLILIHGTNLWWHRAPEWSVPGSPLFEFIHTRLRSDVYSGTDYFRWEGNYNEYGREIAARNLQEWVSNRQFQGVDVVAHSHGGNVILKATEFGATFGHVLLLNCPVRPNYAFRERSAITARSVRTSFDLVILADRAGQRFPPRSGIVEEYLPWWYSHSKTTDPKIWQRHNIRV